MPQHTHEVISTIAHEELIPLTPEEKQDVVAKYESGEDIVVESFKQAGDYACAICEHLMVERYGWNGKEYMPYHNVRHPEFVARESLIIFDEIKQVVPWELAEVDEQVWKAAQAAMYSGVPYTGPSFDDLLEKLNRREVYQKVLAFSHDLKQQGRLDEHGKRVRQRGIEPGGNEFDTAEELYEILGKFKYADGSSVFGDISLERLHNDIHPTFVTTEIVSVIGLNGAAINTVALKQIANTKETPMSGKILGLCDLRAAYTKDYSIAAAWGDMEFLELNYDVLTAIRGALDSKGLADPLNRTAENSSAIFDAIRDYTGTLPPEKISDLVRDIYNWYNGQFAFYQLQETETINVINSIDSPQAREVLNKHFTLDGRPTRFHINSLESGSHSSMMKLKSGEMALLVVGMKLSPQALTNMQRNVLNESLFMFVQEMQFLQSE